MDEVLDVRRIVRLYLVRMGADGLYSERGECGCPVTDLMPCDSPCDTCEPAKSVYCPSCGNNVYVPVGNVWQNNVKGI